MINQKRIELKIYGGIATVNCYLLKVDSGFILIDTGPSSKRDLLDNELEKKGCKVGDLKLILITHGDSDHTGNAAYLRQKYGVPIAMHPDDEGMVQTGNMSHNRKVNLVVRILFTLPFIKLNKSDRFKGDIDTNDGLDLGDYGLNAKIIHIPGHSSGSIGIITANGDFYCGDLFSNTDKPVLNSIMDDLDAAHDSMRKLKNLDIIMVYPGHGDPFSMDQLILGE
jgi:glyoxylase-like metal-dependent hydrolase (beta-lactamase superfamily II)